MPANLNRVNLNGSHDVTTDKLKNLNFNKDCSEIKDTKLNANILTNISGEKFY